MTTHTYAIVGSYYRPPAKAILSILPANHPLIIRPEPDCVGSDGKEYPNAIAVWIDTSTIPKDCHKDLELTAASDGYSLREILATREIHLGYISDAIARELTDVPRDPPTDIEAKLLFNSSGAKNRSYCVSFEVLAPLTQGEHSE